MRVFETLHDGVCRYVCCSKSTKIPKGYKFVSDVTKETHVERDSLIWELKKTQLPSPVQQLIVELVAQHQQKIFGKES